MLQFVKSSHENYTEEVQRAIARYYHIMHSYHGVVEIVPRCPFLYHLYAYHPLCTERGDRLVDNPKIDFPIGIAFGDRDFMASDGADEIVKRSKFFATGES